ncbi:MAG: 4Fe-4S dicluster domain-containing protein [Chloroflexi bacterium]|nr:4Fe-4S dicluster domain-containing protein [Chloroflexota bacterium]
MTAAVARTKVFRAEPGLCTGCGMCEMLCSLNRAGRINVHQARLRITRLEKTDSFVPVICRHCHPAPCHQACPVPEAMSRDPATGAIAIHEKECIRCLACVEACPFAAIQVGPQKEALKCDLCGGDPICARYCPPRVIYSPDKPYPWPQKSCLEYVAPHEATTHRRQMTAEGHRPEYVEGQRRRP